MSKKRRGVVGPVLPASTVAPPDSSADVSERGSAHRDRFADGALWDRRGQPWRRADDWLDPVEVEVLLAAGADWLVEWCDGRFEWADATASGLLARDVLPSLLTRVKARRLLAKKRVNPTVFVAERWCKEVGASLILFNESAPAPRTASWFG